MLTAVLHGLVGPILAILDIVAHLTAFNTLAAFAQELQWTFAFRGCEENNEEEFLNYDHSTLHKENAHTVRLKRTS